jgi:hypothetical protein
MEIACVCVCQNNDLEWCSGNFDVLDDELDPRAVSVTILKDSEHVVWQSKPGKSEGLFRLTDAIGKYEMCFSNGLNDWSKKRNTEEHEKDEYENEADDDSYEMDRHIGFNVHVNDMKIMENLDKIDGPSKAEIHAKFLVDLSDTLSMKLDDMVDHQSYLQEREFVHRELSEQTFSRVVGWTVTEAIALMTIAIGQIMYLRKFLESRRYL